MQTVDSRHSLTCLRGVFMGRLLDASFSSQKALQGAASAQAMVDIVRKAQPSLSEFDIREILMDHIEDHRLVLAQVGLSFWTIWVVEAAGGSPEPVKTDAAAIAIDFHFNRTKNGHDLVRESASKYDNQHLHQIPG